MVHHLRSLPLALLMLFALLLSGCGAGASGDSSMRKGTETDANGDASANASASFIGPNKQKTEKYVEFGKEAPPAIRDEASRVLTENLKARETADFTTQCATLTLKEAQLITEDKGSAAAKNCPKKLKQSAEPLSNTESVRADLLSGPIAALRVRGNRAYALFHGSDKSDYAMPMVNEGGQWKVGSVKTVRLGKTGT